jgi:hypothetical protein
VNKLKHFWGAISAWVVLGLQAQTLSAEIHDFTPCEYFRGTIGNAPVRILLSSTDSTASGFLFYEKTGAPFWLFGFQKNNSLYLGEYLREHQEYPLSGFSDPDLQTGNVVLKRTGDILSGEWKNPAGTKSLPVKFTLVSEPLMDPQQLLKMIGSASSRMEIMTAMSRWLTGPVPELFYFDSYYERRSDPPEVPADFFVPEEVEASILSGDITDAEGEEVLLKVNLRHYRTLLFVLEKHEQSWVAIPEYLVETEEPDMVNCLDGENARFLQASLIPVCDGKNILQLIHEYGYCDGPSRGGHVERKLYRISSGTFSEITWIVEQDYWYNSPCPNATQLPVEVAFEFVAEDGSAFASRLKCTHTVYRMEHVEDDGNGCVGMDATEVGEAIQWVELCEE